MAKIFLAFICLIAYLAFWAKLIEWFQLLRIRKGFQHVVTVTINDDHFELQMPLGNVMCIEPTVVVYRTGKWPKRGIIAIGSRAEAERKIFKSKDSRLVKRHFVKDFDLVKNDLDDFLYHFFIYLAVKSKALFRLPILAIVSFDAAIEVSQPELREKLSSEVLNLKESSHPRLFNILHVRIRGTS